MVTAFYVLAALCFVGSYAHRDRTRRAIDQLEASLFFVAAVLLQAM